MLVQFGRLHGRMPIVVPWLSCSLTKVMIDLRVELLDLSPVEE
jgi:hypothetical protein